MFLLLLLLLHVILLHLDLQSADDSGRSAVLPRGAGRNYGDWVERGRGRELSRSSIVGYAQRGRAG